MGSINPTDTVDFYSSPYLAEHYDLMCANEGAFYNDIGIYMTELEKIQARKRARGDDPNEVVVVDVGTGTGRALHGLARAAEAKNVDLSKAIFVGFDPAQAMVDRAAQTRGLANVGRTVWHCASAVNLDQVLDACGLQGKVDLVLFADGGFLHLETAEECCQFLQSLGSALRAGIGRACLSITNQDSVRNGANLNFHDTSGAAKEYGSQQYKGLVYRNSWAGATQQGPVHIWTFQFEVIRVTGDGRHELLETRQTQLRGRAWTEMEVTEMVSRVGGVKLMDVRRDDPLQTFYLLERAG